MRGSMMSDLNPEARPGEGENGVQVATSRPATAMRIAMDIIGMAEDDLYSTEAQIRAQNLVEIANTIAQSGVVMSDSDRDVLHDRVVREYVRRPYLFHRSDFNRCANVAAMDNLEFEPDGNLIKLRHRGRFSAGAR